MREKFAERQTLNSRNAYRIGPMRRRNTKATTLIHDGLSSKLRYIVNKYGDASFFVSDNGLGDSANSDWFGINKNFLENSG